MVPSRPAYVLFDLGNVLVHIHPEAFLQSLGIDTPANRVYYQQKVVDIARRYERGAESTDQFLARLDTLFNGPGDNKRPKDGRTKIFSKGDFRAAMRAIIGQPMAGMEGLVRRTSAKAPLGLLSNTNPIHFDFCKETLTVLRYIPSYFLSYQLKAFKPEPEIFEQVAGLLKLPPRDILYIDDLEENAEAAKSVGFEVCLFKGQRELEGQLAKLQLT